MEYRAVEYTCQEDAMAAFLKMKRRKQEWVEKTEEEFRTLRERAMQLA